MNEYMEIAINESMKAYKNKDIPVGAVIIKNNKIIAKAYNKKQKSQISTKHAEIEVIEKACKKLKSWHLDDCELYVTMEPCIMCTGAIIQSRIKKVVYGVNNPKFGLLNSIKNSSVCKKIEIDNGILNLKIEKILKEFFKEMRNNK